MRISVGSSGRAEAYMSTQEARKGANFKSLSSPLHHLLWSEGLPAIASEGGGLPSMASLAATAGSLPLCAHNLITVYGLSLMICKVKLHKAFTEELIKDVKSYKRLANEPSNDLSSRCRRVMEASFLKINEEVGDNVGTTIVVAIIGPFQIFVANCGDSRAILSCGWKVVPLSRDHKPDREDEMNWITAARGRIIYWDGYRIGGLLAMSRAIGNRSHAHEMVWVLDDGGKGGEDCVIGSSSPMKFGITKKLELDGLREVIIGVGCDARGTTSYLQGGYHGCGHGNSGKNSLGLLEDVSIQMLQYYL
ncbi:hypothetical protein L7F22_046176 [Adiantum nelumboides]|nr:hypothetical protein [Adiantum nelumboides]